VLRRLGLVDRVDEDVDLPARGGQELERRPGGAGEVISFSFFVFTFGFLLFLFFRFNFVIFVDVVVVDAQEGVRGRAGGLVLAVWFVLGF